MPISLNHPGLVHLLHVGRNDDAGYFYYVMELGDDQSAGTKIVPEIYVPRNLSQELQRRGPLSVAECVDLFLPLTEALAYLHGERLVHRDIKPSNIIFVKGLPKFADVGLVTGVASETHDVSYVGTEGYIAPEGPGTPSADVFSLGIVLYEAATGMDRRKFPELPETVLDRPDAHDFLSLNRVMVKACQEEPAKRPSGAAAIRDDLLLLQRQLREREEKATIIPPPHPAKGEPPF